MGIGLYLGWGGGQPLIPYMCVISSSSEPGCVGLCLALAEMGLATIRLMQLPDGRKTFLSLRGVWCISSGCSILVCFSDHLVLGCWLKIAVIAVEYYIAKN